MVNFLKDFDWKKTGIFAAGVAFGTAGIKVLSDLFTKILKKHNKSPQNYCDDLSFY